jgi:hypothetical protein
MFKFIKFLNVILLVTFLINPLYAHHSRAMFDDNNPIELSGTVVDWQFSNPHVFIILEVIDESGISTRWTLEGLGPNTIYRQGWTPNSLQAGDKIILDVDPLFSGARGGSYKNPRWDDGAEIDPYAGRP